jgi:hypothetical protein
MVNVDTSPGYRAKRYLAGTLVASFNDFAIDLRKAYDHGQIINTYYFNEDNHTIELTFLDSVVVTAARRMFAAMESFTCVECITGLKDPAESYKEIRIHLIGGDNNEYLQLKYEEIWNTYF